MGQEVSPFGFVANIYIVYKFPLYAHVTAVSAYNDA